MGPAGVGEASRYPREFGGKTVCFFTRADDYLNPFILVDGRLDTGVRGLLTAQKSSGDEHRSIHIFVGLFTFCCSSWSATASLGFGHTGCIVNG